MKGSGAPERPVPVPDALTAPFWDAAADHRLVAPRCQACRTLVLPPDVVCGRCQSTDPAWVWEDLSGRGRLRSWTIGRRSFLPGFDDPPVIIDVELIEQDDLRIISRLLDGPEAELQVGAGVTVAFDDVTDEVSLPVFALDQR